MDEVGLVTYAGFLVGGVGLPGVPLVNRAMPMDVFREGYELSTVSCSLSSDKWGCVLFYWLFGLCVLPLEPAGSWVGLGLGAIMATSGRAHSSQYSLGPLLSVSLSF